MHLLVCDGDDDVCAVFSVVEDLEVLVASRQEDIPSLEYYFVPRVVDFAVQEEVSFGR